jgi:hypothetical protein
MVGRDLKIEIRQIGRNVDSLRRYAAELVALAPDVIFSIGSLTAASLQQATRTIPIVFMNVTDPVGAGLVESMARPGGNDVVFGGSFADCLGSDRLSPQESAIEGAQTRGARREVRHLGLHRTGIF